MLTMETTNEYKLALAEGQKRMKDKNAVFPVLETILGENASICPVQSVGLMEIPLDLVVGVRNQARRTAFAPGFMPLLELGTEFAYKWIELCDAHLTQGIVDPVLVYEYLGKFYVEEGNKRVSVLKHFEATYVYADVRRVLPPNLDAPEFRVYNEFLEFFRIAGLYDLQFSEPGAYSKLLSRLPFADGQEWSDEDRKAFRASYYYFTEAFAAIHGNKSGVHPSDAFLLWLEVYPFEDLSRMLSEELKTSLVQLWNDVLAGSNPLESVDQVPEAGERSFISALLRPEKRHVSVAFVHQRDKNSPWTKAHEEGREYLKEALGDRVSTASYYNADSPGKAESLIEQAVTEGADIVFTTSPPLIRRTLAVAVRHPEVIFFNCAPDITYSSVFGYYFRAYEGKFITGAIAGAMAKDGRIGYIAPYPILGTTAEINAFALGAQMTNPDAQIYLKWSAVRGNHVKEFMDEGIHVISNRDTPVQEEEFLRYGEYGLYLAEEAGDMTPLCSPYWMWGKFYESVVRAVLANTKLDQNGVTVATNFFLGIDAGAIDVLFTEALPDGVRFLAEKLKESLRNRELDIFARGITAQDGTVMSDGARKFSFDELLHMDWLCNNVIGSIPEYNEIRPISQRLVRIMGLHRDRIPPENGGLE